MCVCVCLEGGKKSTYASELLEHTRAHKYQYRRTARPRIEFHYIYAAISHNKCTVVDAVRTEPKCLFGAGRVYSPVRNGWRREEVFPQNAQ